MMSFILSSLNKKFFLLSSHERFPKFIKSYMEVFSPPCRRGQIQSSSKILVRHEGECGAHKIDTLMHSVMLPCVKKL